MAEKRKPVTHEDKLNAAREEAKKRAQQLSEEMGVEVKPLIFSVGDSEPVVGFMRKPNRMVTLAIMDKFNAGFYSACDQALELVIIKEHSSPLILSEADKDQVYRLGAVNVLSEWVQFAGNFADKKK